MRRTDNAKTRDSQRASMGARMLRLFRYIVNFGIMKIKDRKETEPQLIEANSWGCFQSTRCQKITRSEVLPRIVNRPRIIGDPAASFAVKEFGLL